MKPDIVVDVGNSRVKWGYCQAGKIAQLASLAHDDPLAWGQQLTAWIPGSKTRWGVSGVHPQARDQLVKWIRERGDEVAVVDSWQQLPIAVAIPEKDRVGIDRLFNAVAARARVDRPADIVMIDAGTAVTVDWLDSTGSFRGGAIFPGLRLMAQALHDYTARLPVVEPPLSPDVRMPGTNTVSAIEAGIFWAVAGGIQALLDQLSKSTAGAPEIFLTGGDGALVASVLDERTHLWPEMTLEGIRLTAETLP
jgi:type III pantothenate kinase